MPSISDITHAIKNLNEGNAELLISEGLTKLTPEMLEKAVKEWQDPLLLSEYLHLDNPAVKWVAKTFVLIPYWDRIDHTLTDPWELYNQISKDPAKKKILDTDRGRRWLTYARNRCYSYYYNYTWE